MKKIKNTLLSVLLFSFAFLVVHDYAIAQVDLSHTYELSNKSEISDSTALSIGSQIHETIHLMIACDIEKVSSSALILDNKPSDVEFALSTHDSFVLDRPPLS